MSLISASVVASISVVGANRTIQLLVSEPTLVDVDITLPTTGADQIVGVGIPDTKVLSYLLIFFDKKVEFKVLGDQTMPLNNDAVVIPMEAGGSIQFVGRVAGPTSPARVILNSIRDTGTVIDTFSHLLVTPNSSNTRMRVIALHG